MSQLAFDAADEAVKRVEENANQAWLVCAHDAVRAVAGRMRTFTTDDVWDMLLLVDVTTHEPRAMGAVMRRAVKEGVCVPTSGYEKSGRVECHARPVRVWRSLLFNPLRDLTRMSQELPGGYR